MVIYMDVPKPFLDDQDVAELLDIDRKSVWLYVHLEVLPPPVLIGGRQWYFRRLDIRNWAERRKEV